MDNRGSETGAGMGVDTAAEQMNWQTGTDSANVQGQVAPEGMMPGQENLTAEQRSAVLGQSARPGLQQLGSQTLNNVRGLGNTEKIVNFLGVRGAGEAGLEQAAEQLGEIENAVEFPGESVGEETETQAEANRRIDNEYYKRDTSEALSFEQRAYKNGVKNAVDVVRGEVEEWERKKNPEIAVLVRMKNSAADKMLDNAYGRSVGDRNNAA